MYIFALYIAAYFCRSLCHNAITTSITKVTTSFSSLSESSTSHSLHHCHFPFIVSISNSIIVFFLGSIVMSIIVRHHQYQHHFPLTIIIVTTVIIALLEGALYQWSATTAVTLCRCVCRSLCEGGALRHRLLTGCSSGDGSPLLRAPEVRGQGRRQLLQEDHSLLRRSQDPSLDILRLHQRSVFLMCYRECQSHVTCHECQFHVTYHECQFHVYLTMHECQFSSCSCSVTCHECQCSCHTFKL